MGPTSPLEAVPPKAPTGPRPYAAWKSRNYQFFAASWFLMVFAGQIQTLAVGLHIYDKTDSPLSLGWLGLIQALPIILLAIAGGQIADRFDRRRVMMANMAVTTLVAVGLAAISAGGGSVTWIYLLLSVGAVAQALGTPSRAAMLPQLVPLEDFSNAVNWNTSIFRVASMLGPAVGGMIVGVQKSSTAAFLLVAVLRLFSLAGIAAMRTRWADRSDQSISLQTVLAGIRFVYRTKLILAAIALDLFAVLLGGATYILPIYARDILHVGPSGLGFLASAEAVGAVTMGLLIAHLPPMRRAGRDMLLAVAGFGAATIVFGLSPWFWLSLAMMFLIGAFDNISVVVRHTLVQVLTPDQMRGRVSAVNNIFIVASNDLGGLESGLTTWAFETLALGSGLAGIHSEAAARAFGAHASVIMGGIGSILVVFLAAKLWPQLARLGSLQDLQPVELDGEEQPCEEDAVGVGSAK